MQPTDNSTNELLGKTSEPVKTSPSLAHTASGFAGGIAGTLGVRALMGDLKDKKSVFGAVAQGLLIGASILGLQKYSSLRETAKQQNNHTDITS